MTELFRLHKDRPIKPLDTFCPSNLRTRTSILGPFMVVACIYIGQYMTLSWIHPTSTRIYQSMLSMAWGFILYIYVNMDKGPNQNEQHNPTVLNCTNAFDVLMNALNYNRLLPKRYMYTCTCNIHVLHAHLQPTHYFLYLPSFPVSF